MFVSNMPSDELKIVDFLVGDLSHVGEVRLSSPLCDLFAAFVHIYILAWKPVD
jgi:hypothetical protein